MYRSRTHAATTDIQRIHLRNHLQVLAVGWLVYVADLAMSWSGRWSYGGDAPERLVLVALGAVFMGRLAVRRQVSRSWEVAGFSLLATALLAHVVVAVQARGPSAATLLASGLWLYLVYVYAFYVLSVRTARWFAGIVWLASGVAAVPAFLGPNVGGGDLVAFVQFKGGGLVAIVLASALSAWRTALGEANLRAEQAERESLTDLLTGQPNRRAMQLAVHRELARSRRTGAPFSLILLDIDSFKVLNDAHGHGVGDAVLMELARELRDGLRAGDELGRWGGEEFLLVAPATGTDDALQLAERLRGRLESHAWQVGQVTASFGVTTSRPGDGLEHLFKRADDALYRAKELGRNRCEVELGGAPRGGPGRA